LIKNKPAQKLSAALKKPSGLTRRLFSFFLANTIVLSLSCGAYACGPDFPEAIMVSGLHPDLPLGQFARGNLGVIQAGYARSYLIVAYRYLSGNPLDAQEQSGIYKLWQQRLKEMLVNQELGGVPANSDPRVDFFRLRAKVLGEKLKEDTSIYDLRCAENILPDAFRNALKTMRALIQQFGQSSAPVREWLAAQDQVFGITYGTCGDPPAAPADAPPVIRAHRAYQEASAKFYTGDMTGAQQLFETIARDKTSPWRELASYMAARAVVKAALDSNDDQSLADALKYTKELAAREPNNPYKPDLFDLCSAIVYRQSTAEESLEALTKAATQRHNPSFGRDTGDLTCLFREVLDDFGNLRPADDPKDEPVDFPAEKYDLSDWLLTMHQPDETWSFLGVEAQKQFEQTKKRRAAHALSKWRKTHSLPWFVAAVCGNNLTDKNNQDLALAASRTRPDSQAFLTAKFYLADSLIKANRKTEAHKVLQEVLAEKEMPPSARNLFMCQMMTVASSVPEFLFNIVQKPAFISTSFCAAQIPQEWEGTPKSGLLFSAPPVLADTLTADLNANLPQSYWLNWAKSKTVPKSVRGQIILAAWLRSKLLGQESGLDDLLVESYPQLKKGMAEYHSAPEGQARRFALACLILSNCGMSPYLEAGLQRHDQDIHDWDSFNQNFWLPLPPAAPAKVAVAKNTDSAFDSATRNFRGAKSMAKTLAYYSTPVLAKILTAGERKQMEAESKTIWTNHPSHFLGEPILEWARSHPKDARVPAMLYSLVKLPKWSSRSDVGTKYSKEAFQLLHKQYPDSSWAQKADYWY
jgi:outer membrane protein assembly factor BamD (BamD/ComL family)